MKDAMRKAYLEKGEELPKNKGSNTSPKQGRPGSLTKAEMGQFKKGGRKAAKSTASPKSKNAHQKTKGAILINAPMIQQQQPKQTRCPQAQHPKVGGYRIDLAAGARLAFGIDQQKNVSLLNADLLQSQTVQCQAVTCVDQREVVLGLDFGTSSAKVVIGDPALGRAFAVPFMNDAGVSGYLLPCRLYQAGNIFSLLKGDQIHRDLKLSLVANPAHVFRQDRVIAFLACVIRYARSWLLQEHLDKYRQSQIFWKLRIGLPTAYHLDDQLSENFLKIAHIAWLVAGAREKITSNLIDAARVRWEELTGNPQALPNESEDVEVQVVPEIAAQIYGFVKSHRFDPDTRNIYLMVDVGAGSVDSSLFQVKQAHRGFWDFEFFTSVVEPHGVMNLHRHRVDWWQQALSENGATKNASLTASLESLKLPTDREIAIPNCYSQYFTGITARFDDSSQTPDARFHAKVLGQVQTKTYWQTWKSQLLSKSDLRDIPTFYCGGGIRMPFYGQLQEHLESFSNMTWMSAKPRQIERPYNLEAPGLHQEDYDRLSVAYGLSFLEVGKVVKAKPKPLLDIQPSSSWRDNYTDKDCC